MFTEQRAWRQEHSVIDMEGGVGGGGGAGCSLGVLTSTRDFVLDITVSTSFSRVEDQGGNLGR